MKKVISILAVLVSVSVNAADPFAPIPMPKFSIPAPVFTLPVYTAPATIYRPITVSAYTTSSGTYVAPYVRSRPNATTTDNYSAKGIVNPFTGVAGTRKAPGQ